MSHFLSKILRNERGNALMIMAAALVPLTILVGSAVDVSRAYMAKSKLQSACDAASLAARRVMQGDELSDDVIATGTEYLDFNYPDGIYGSTTLDPEFSHPEAGVVRIEASTTIPTVLMHLFGFDSLPVVASCDASLNFVNTDVLLVLDVTGSMADPVDGTPKIEALREAVLALYDELEPVQTQLQAQGLRLRYGIVPYSSTVNVGRLIYDVDPSYIRSSITVPSRVANMNTNEGPITYTANSPTISSDWEISGSSRSKSSCQTWVNSADANGGGPEPTARTTTKYDGSATAASYVEATNWSWRNASDTSGDNRSCRRWRIVTTTTYNTVYPRKVFTNWTYRQETYDTSTFKTPTGSILLATNANGSVSSAGGSFNAQQLAASGTDVSSTAISWTGCIEEADTATASLIDGGTSLTIPASAHDLNVNLIPDSNATRWRPQLPDAIYQRTAGTTSVNVTEGSTSRKDWIKVNREVVNRRLEDVDIPYSKGYWACPAEARRLSEWDREAMETYTNLLQPVGGTYHDIGMIWGARMISTGGIFADGCNFYNEMPCNRHIIFMTDGQQTAYCDKTLTAYGVEQEDKRVTDNSSCPSQLARHQQRFRMICNAAKSMNASVWVIGFATSLNSNLTGCASNTGQATTSTDSESLIARFRQIGNQIGALRLTR